MVLNWNCRGIENHMTVRRFMELNKKKSCNIIFLQETKNLNEFVLKEVESLNLYSHFLIPPCSQGAGSLALLWKNYINLQILSSNQNHIDTLITYKNAIFIYGDPDITKCKRSSACCMVYDVSSDIDFIGRFGVVQSDLYSHMVVKVMAV